VTSHNFTFLWQHLVQIYCTELYYYLIDRHFHTSISPSNALLLAFIRIFTTANPDTFYFFLSISLPISPSPFLYSFSHCQHTHPRTEFNVTSVTTIKNKTYVVSVFHRGVNQIFVLLGCYKAYSGSCQRFGTTYRPHLQRPSSILGLLDPRTRGRQVVPKRRQRTTNLRCVTSQKSEDLINETSQH
jgi:hypothetical protein